MAKMDLGKWQKRISKKYKLKPTRKQLLLIKEAWKRFQYIEECFYQSIGKLEDKIAKETGIKDIIFFNSDGDWCGIGNKSRSMKLLQREDLEN
jgi:hypothetical protein